MTPTPETKNEAPLWAVEEAERLYEIAMSSACERGVLIPSLAHALARVRSQALDEAIICAEYKRAAIAACEHVPGDRLALASKNMATEIEISIRALKEKDPEA